MSELSNVAPPPGEAVLSLRGVSKNFGAVSALTDIDLDVHAGEVVALVGDNGAGKSTLIKVMTGVMPPTSGRIFIRDEELNPADYSVRMAHDLAIETVYQDRSLADKQPLWRNFFVGRQITNRLGFIDVGKQREIANRILKERIGFRGVGIDADSPVRKLSGGERQGVAIGRAMHFEKDLIVLDEPTVALAIKEVQKVLDFVRSIKAQGKACVYIEHNLAHVHELADRLVILDRGRIVREFAHGEVTIQELTRFLIDLQHAKAAPAA